MKANRLVSTSLPKDQTWTTNAGTTVKAPAGWWSTTTPNLQWTFGTETVEVDRAEDAPAAGLPPDGGYHLRGWFQGAEYTVFVESWEHSPIEAVMKAVLRLKDGEQILSVLVANRDGNSDIRSIEAPDENEAEMA